MTRRKLHMQILKFGDRKTYHVGKCIDCGKRRRLIKYGICLPCLDDLQAKSERKKCE